MSKHFPRERHALTVTVGDHTHTFYIRELGYLEFQDLRAAVITNSIDSKDESAKNRAGLRLMDAVVLAAVEEKDGTPSYTDEEWRKETGVVVTKLGKEALKHQGIDLDKLAKQKELTEEEAEGNALPSRKSGTN